VYGGIKNKPLELLFITPVAVLFSCLLFYFGLNKCRKFLVTNCGIYFMNSVDVICYPATVFYACPNLPVFYFFGARRSVWMASSLRRTLVQQNIAGLKAQSALAN
jgi:hypothetical protein